MYFGSAIGLSARPNLVIDSPDDLPNGFGATAAGVGDVDGDGFGDVLIGTDVSDSCYLYLGSASGCEVRRFDSHSRNRPAGLAARLLQPAM